VLELLPTYLRTPIAFAIVLGVLVFIHEMGHYLAARWRGVYVEAFSIGFGKKLIAWTDKHDTEWRLCALPLGGYVKLHGQEQPEDVTDEMRAAWRPGCTFHEKSTLSRAIVVAAGPVANFVLAAFLFAGLFLFIGRPVSLPVVGEIAANSAAAEAGLRAGDRIVAIDGSAIDRFEQIQAIVVKNTGEVLHLSVLRDGTTIALQATPQDHGGARLLGIHGGKIEYQSVSVIEAVPEGIAQTWSVSVQTLQGVGQMITGKRGTDELGGPLRIAQLSGQVAELGVASLVGFIAVLSVNLGLLNLFPIPILDGGHLVFFAIEALRGRPLPPKAQEYSLRFGFALLASLFVFATRNDIVHSEWFSNLAKLFS